MEPIRTTELALQFAAPLSPWWLLLLLPVAAAVALRLYRGQCRELSRAHALGLTALRVALVALLVFLAFRPSLLWRRILTFPGRIVLLLDDSESMTANDTGLDDVEALRQSRLLGAPVSGAAQPCHDLAILLSDVEEQVRAFQRFAESADRTSDAFWAGAERASLDLASRFDRFAEAAQTVTGLAPEERSAFDEIFARLAELRSGTQPFFTGNRNPPARAYDAYVQKLRDTRARLFAVQAGVDRRALADPNHPLHAAVDALRKQPRLSRISAALAGLDAFARERLPRLALQQQAVMTGVAGNLAEPGSAPLAATPGPTDILRPLDALLQEENPFPLAAIVLLSDGRHIGPGDAVATARLASQKQVPVHAAAVGADREPWDLAVLDVTAPPFAVKGAPVNVRIRLKTILPEPADVRVSIAGGNETLASESIRLGEAPEQTCTLRFVPAATGRFRYSIRVETAAAEIIPDRNNRRDIVINVRDDKVRVLLLDWKPRWETRFLLNILQRLDYIDLNSMIVIAHDDAALARGVRKGTWPQDRATLGLYDLIVLGDLPVDLLSADEWAAVREAVETKGKTLCFLGGESAARPPDAALLDALWPVDPSAAPAAPSTNALPADADVLERFCLATAGRLHPITAAMGRPLPVVPETGVPGLRPGTRVLALEQPGGRPLVTARFAGNGKVLLVDHDALWKRLNPSLLGAHAAMYLNLVSWAVDGDRRTEETANRPLLDQHVLSTLDAVQVWLPGGTTNDVIEAVAGSDVVATRPAVRSRDEADEVVAVFDRLPPRDIRFRAKGREPTGPLMVVEETPELGFLARDPAFLAALADGSGGQNGDLTELRQVLPDIAPRERVEKQERVWRLWDATSIFALLVLMLTAEWIWRKWVGLV